MKKYEKPLIDISWLELKPNEIEFGNSEWFEDYYNRIAQKEEYKHIPKSVFEQWIHPHHNNTETLSNYGWINYKRIEFVLTEFSYKVLKNINIIENFQDYVNLRGSYQDLEEFCCTKIDLHYWQNEGTWREPPIVLDSSNFKYIPSWSNIKFKYQLVEGHSRLGYLNSMKTIDNLKKCKIKDKHKVWLMVK